MKVHLFKINSYLVALMVSCMGISVCTSGYCSTFQNDTTSMIVIPASDFLYELPKGNTMVDASEAGTPWLFNNTAIKLKSLTNMMTQVRVHESGQYFLFVRSQGKEGSSFKIAVDDKVTDTVFGTDSISLKSGGVFNLEAGITTIKVTRIHPGSVFDVIVLSKKPDLSREDLVPFQLNEEVLLLEEYNIPAAGAVKFGDVNGDGLTDFVVLTRDYSAHVFDYSGKQLWSWTAPEAYAKERSQFEAPGVVWDFDQDGKAEVVHWRMDGEKEWLVIADGRSGKVIRQVPWPTKPLPHVYNNFRLAIGKLTEKSPNEIVVFTDMGGTININTYTADLKPLWVHTEERKKDHMGHYIYPVDLNQDGIDEVLTGSLLLDFKGESLWNKFDLFDDHHDHADNYKFADIDVDGDIDIVTANSEVGVLIYEGMTGEILWQQTAEHSQQIEAGFFLEGHESPQVVAGGRTYGNRQVDEPYLSGQLYWFNNKGHQLLKWPGNPLNGNPDFVKGDWQGNGTDQLFWFKFKINGKGEGDLYFADPVYHMFDFTGRGAEEVITLNKTTLRVYGSKEAKFSNNDRKKDLLYLKNKVVNHTHY